MDIFKIVEILHSGREGTRYEPKEGVSHRIGRLVAVNDIKVGLPCLMFYVQDVKGNEYRLDMSLCRTSPVVKWSKTEGDLMIETENSIYLLERKKI